MSIRLIDVKSGPVALLKDTKKYAMIFKAVKPTTLQGKFMYLPGLAKNIMSKTSLLNKFKVTIPLLI